MTMMHKRSSRTDVSQRAWNILRLALLWARKGGVFVFKKRLVLDLQHFVKSLKNSNKGNGALQYGDRQLSFDATPIIHVRMSRPNSMRFKLPHIPCINPHVDCSDLFDHFDDDQSDHYSCYEARRSFLIGNGQEYDDHDEDDDNVYDDNEVCEEQEIDIKAEQFIANFYEQLKLQKQLTREEEEATNDIGIACCFHNFGTILSYWFICYMIICTCGFLGLL